MAKAPNGTGKLPGYGNWTAMKTRCLNPASQDWAHYGGRGITIHQEWIESFLAFYRDMGPRPSPDHTIERIDVNGNYGPGNCTWITSKQQARNRRTARTITHNGETLSVTEWAEKIGISKRTLLMRLNLGWNAERTITEPPFKGKNQSSKDGYLNAA